MHSFFSMIKLIAIVCKNDPAKLLKRERNTADFRVFAPRLVNINTTGVARIIVPENYMAYYFVLYYFQFCVKYQMS